MKDKFFSDDRLRTEHSAFESLGEWDHIHSREYSSVGAASFSYLRADALESLVFFSGSEIDPRGSDDANYAADSGTGNSEEQLDSRYYESGSQSRKQEKDRKHLEPILRDKIVQRRRRFVQFDTL